MSQRVRVGKQPLLNSILQFLAVSLVYTILSGLLRWSMQMLQGGHLLDMEADVSRLEQKAASFPFCDSKYGFL